MRFHCPGSFRPLGFGSLALACAHARTYIERTRWSSCRCPKLAAMRDGQVSGFASDKKFHWRFSRGDVRACDARACARPETTAKTEHHAVTVKSSKRCPRLMRACALVDARVRLPAVIGSTIRCHSESWRTLATHSDRTGVSLQRRTGQDRVTFRGTPRGEPRRATGSGAYFRFLCRNPRGCSGAVIHSLIHNETTCQIRYFRNFIHISTSPTIGLLLRLSTRLPSE